MKALKHCYKLSDVCIAWKTHPVIQRCALNMIFTDSVCFVSSPSLYRTFELLHQHLGCSDWHCHGEEGAFLLLMLQELLWSTQMLRRVSSHLNWGFWALAMHKCSKFTAFPSLLLFRPKAKAAAETTWVKLAQLNSVKLLEETQCCFLCYWSHGTWLSNYCSGAGRWPVGGAQSQNPHL